MTTNQEGDSEVLSNATKLENYYKLFTKLTGSEKNETHHVWDTRIDNAFHELYDPDLVYVQPGRSELNFKEWLFVARTVYESDAEISISKIEEEDQEDYESVVKIYAEVVLPDGFRGNLDRTFYFKDGKVIKAIPSNPDVLEQLADHAMGKYFYVPG